MKDIKKFEALFDEVGIEYKRVGNELEIDPFDFDGHDGLIVKFYDDGQFKEFGYIGLDPLRKEINNG
jgi:hypothetical protein